MEAVAMDAITKDLLVSPKKEEILGKISSLEGYG